MTPPTDGSPLTNGK